MSTIFLKLQMKIIPNTPDLRSLKLNHLKNRLSIVEILILIEGIQVAKTSPNHLNITQINGQPC